MRLRTLIVGFGHAGRDLHLPCVRRLWPTAEVGVVEPSAAVRAGLAASLRSYPEIDQADAFPPDDTVVHVCTPPGEHLGVIAAATALGYRKFIVEKPLAGSVAEAARVLELTRQHGLQVVVVANWLASALTERLSSVISSSTVAVEDVTMRQMKSRVRVSLDSSGHTSAAQVELPHLVALAQYLFGPGLETVDAKVRDLVVGRRRRPGLGGASLQLRTSGRVRLDLCSDLTSPVVERSVRIRWRDGAEACGFYSCDSRDMYSQLIRYDSDGQLVEHRLFDDDTLARLMTGAYAWFTGAGTRPVSDVALHLEVCRILDLATNHDIGQVTTA